LNKFLDNHNLLFAFIILFLFLTNSYFSLEDSLKYGAADGYFYNIIAEKFPNFPNEKMSAHYAQRFIIPYLIGFISKVFFIETILTFRILTILLIFIIIYLFKNINEELGINKITIFISSSILVLNPYLFRFYLSNPTIIVDLFFIIGFLGLILSIIKNNKLFFYFFFIIGLISRQTALAFLISSFVCFFFQKKKFFKKRDLIFLSLITIITFLFIKNITDQISFSNSFPWKSTTGIFHYFFRNFNIINLFIFLTLPLIGYFQIIFFYFLIKKNKKKFSIDKIFIFILSATVVIILQPIFGGPLITGKNIIRLTLLALPAILILINRKYSLNQISKNLYFFIFFLFMSSLHPRFSKILIVFDIF
jgi:hypothetical protein